MFQNLVCILDLRLQVLAAVSVQSIAVFCDDAVWCDTCYRRFGRTCCFHLEGRDTSVIEVEVTNRSTQTIVSGSSPEMLVLIY